MGTLMFYVSAFTTLYTVQGYYNKYEPQCPRFAIPCGHPKLTSMASTSSYNILAALTIVSGSLPHICATNGRSSGQVVKCSDLYFFWVVIILECNIGVQQRLEPYLRVSIRKGSSDCQTMGAQTSNGNQNGSLLSMFIIMYSYIISYIISFIILPIETYCRHHNIQNIKTPNYNTYWLPKPQKQNPSQNQSHRLYNKHQQKSKDKKITKQLMKFRIKSNRQPLLKRDKIHIRSLSQLLPNRIIVRQPEHNLSARIFYPEGGVEGKREDGGIGGGGEGDWGKGRRQKKLGSEGKSERLEDIRSISSFQKYQSKTSYKANMLSNGSESTQLKKRSTMPHFRYRSLDFTSEKASKTLSNKMWTAIHYEYMPNINKPPETSKKPQQQKQAALAENRKKMKMQFLKKGSNINKRVVINLLKLKLLSKDPDEQPGPADIQSDNTIRNNQILNMIKIYKGYGQDPSLGYEKGTRNLREAVRNNEQDWKDELNIKAFPFRNLNIELSVSEWRNKKQYEGAGSPLVSQIDEQIQKM